MEILLGKNVEGWGRKVQGSLFGNITKAFFWENLRKAFFWENIRIFLSARKFHFWKYKHFFLGVFFLGGGGGEEGGGNWDGKCW